MNNKGKILSAVVMLLLGSSNGILINNNILENNNDAWDDIAGENDELAQSLIQKDLKYYINLND